MSYFFTGVQRQGLVLGTTALDISGQMTCTAWFKPAAMGRVHGIYAKPYGQGQIRWRLNVQSDNSVNFWTRWSSGSFDGMFVAGGAIINGWNFIAGIKRATTQDIFLNGAIVASGANANGVGDGPVDLGLFNGDDNSLYTNGWGAECAVWNAALTNEELWALWRGANASWIRSDVLRLYLPMYGPPGNVVPDGTKGHVDLSGAGFHAQTQFGTSDTTFVDIHPPVQSIAPVL